MESRVVCVREQGEGKNTFGFPSRGTVSVVENQSFFWRKTVPEQQNFAFGGFVNKLVKISSNFPPKNLSKPGKLS